MSLNFGNETSPTSDETFASDVANGLVLVDFYAPWCAPCRALAPKLEELSAEIPERILKIDTDINQGTPANLGVRGLPTLVLFKNGVEIERLMGNQSKEAILEMITRNR